MPRNHSKRTDQDSSASETITPISLNRTSESSTNTAVNLKSSGSRFVVFGLLIALLVVGIGVFYYLPKAVVKHQADTTRNTPQSNTKDSGRTVENSGESGSPPVTNASIPQNELAPSQVAQLPEARDQAQAVLEELLKQQATLENASVKLWAAERFAEATANAAIGDDAFVNKNYASSRETFSAALAIMNELVARIESELAAAIKQGQDSLNAKDSAAATLHFERALKIDSQSSAAAIGLERARNLDELLALLATGKSHDNQDDLQAAQQSYQQAVKLDGESEQARQALAGVNNKISSRSFNRYMTAGFMALEKADYESARKSFGEAGRIRPQSAEVSEALAQVDSQQKLQKISAHREQADRLKSQEQWQQAITEYGAVLDIDPNLGFAREGKAYSQERLAIMQRLTGYLQSPGRLSAQSVYDEVSGYLKSLDALSEKGPELNKQIASLSRQLEIAATPLPVEIISNNETRVAVYQVGQFDAFLKKDLKLRPGTYTVVGSRTGYRDVRKVFEVMPDKGPISIVVKCEEPI